MDASDKVRNAKLNSKGMLISDVSTRRENFISQCPYNDADAYIHGFQATHQPAIWMGESGQVVLSPGVGDVKPLFEQRAHSFSKRNEISTPYVFEVTMDAESVEADQNLTESIYSPVPGGAQPVPGIVSEGANGRTRRAVPVESEPTGLPKRQSTPQNDGGAGAIHAALTATSHVGYMRLNFANAVGQPYLFIQATRQNWTGQINIDPSRQELSGSNPQRQDYALGPLHAPGFRGYFVSRFSRPFTSYGIANAGELKSGVSSGNGEHLGAYVKFSDDCSVIEVRTGVSFVSVDQARRNLNLEASNSITFEDAVENVKMSWLDKLGRVTIEGFNETDEAHDPRTIWYTALFHALQYPSDFSEPLDDGQRTFYSGYTDSVHKAADSYYQSWSIWDTFRAEHSLLTMFAPERVNGMMRSLIRIFECTGRLPMWANVVETNIMVGTHVDAVLANALERGFKQLNIALAWAGVKKNAYVPPIDDIKLLYYDREPHTPNEVRAGLTTYLSKGYVANDRWAESGSRTLDYAFDDYAASKVAAHAGDDAASQELFDRSMANYRTLYNNDTGFMEAKNDNETWAGRDQGWSEGDDWIYTFNVMHDPKGLAELMGGRDKMKAKLDRYFDGGHNEHSNEPSHHAPYMYAAIGYPAWTQNLTRFIAWTNYNATSAGLSGNEDLGQMSAWYLFSALGFYPVNPASDEYVIGAPFFEKVSIRFPAGAATGGVGGEEHTLVITAPGAVTKPFVKGLKVDDVDIERPLLHHKQIITASSIAFEMDDERQQWGAKGIFRRASERVEVTP